MLISSNAKIPTKTTEHGISYDLYASKWTLIPSHGRAAVNTGIKIALPHGTYGRIAGLWEKAQVYGLIVSGGVIESDYTGEIRVILQNLTSQPYLVSAGEPVALLICEQYVNSLAYESSYNTN